MPVATGGGIIDVHSHVVPHRIVTPVSGDMRWPEFRSSQDHLEIWIAGQLFRTVTRASWDPAVRLDDMDRQGVDVQVLSPMPELFSYWAPAVDAATWCSSLNRWIADACATAPSRFLGFGSLPMQDVNAAVEALHELTELGLRGAQIGSNVEGVLSADRRFLPVYQAAEALGLSLFVHAFHPPYAGCLAASPQMAASVSFPAEIGLCAAALIGNGIIDTCPDLRVGCSHGGGSLALHLPRMDHSWRAETGDSARLPRSPRSYARSMWYDCLLYEVDALRFAISSLGPDRVVVGSDYPFLADRPGHLIDDEFPLQSAERDALRRGNACRFLALS